MPADTAAVLLAAGRGRRLGQGNKALLSLGGRPVFERSLHALRESPSIAECILVLHAEDSDRMRERWQLDPAELGVRIVEGGAERWQSSRAGCAAASDACRYVLVHDAARPFVDVEIIESVMAATRSQRAALAAEAVADTLKRADEGQCVADTVPRENLWRAQTPQAAERELLLQAFEAWPKNSPPPTDECVLLEALGIRPALVSAPGNFKITVPTDLALAEARLDNARHQA